MKTSVSQAAGLFLVLAMMTAACSSAGGTGTVWWGQDQQADSAVLAIPYDLMAADHDRAYASLVIDPDPAVPLPADARFDYVRQLREAKQSPPVLARGLTIVQQLTSLPADDDTLLAATIGYHDLVAPAGSLSAPTESSGFATRGLTDRFGFTSPVQAASAQGDARAAVILIHGDASSPGYLSGKIVLPLGIPEYHRTPGPQWSAAGYDVFIPLMQGVTADDFDEFGYSFIGLEASRILDLVTAIRAETDVPIVLVGLSRGALVAEVATVYDPGIAATVSSGGSVRWAPATDTPVGNAAVFELLTERDFVISATTNDVYTRWTIAQAFGHLAKLDTDFDAAGGSLEIVKFVGFHEMWAPGDIQAVTQLLDAQ